MQMVSGQWSGVNTIRDPLLVFNTTDGIIHDMHVVELFLRTHPFSLFFPSKESCKKETNDCFASRFPIS